MIKLTEIERSELPELILSSYEGDQKLLDQYHIEKFESKEEAVKKELELIDNIVKKIPLIYLKVSFDDKEIGYVVKSGRFLYSFALNKKYRTTQIKDSWWDALKKNLGQDLTCAVFSNNIRALSFLKSKGMKVFKEQEIENGLTEIYLKH